MAPIMAVFGAGIILLSLVFRGTGFGIFLLTWAILTALAYSVEWYIYGPGQKSPVGWFSSRPLCLCCWILIASFTMLRLLS